MRRWGTASAAAMVVAIALGCVACVPPGRDTLAGFIRGSWDCAMEESVADADLYPLFVVRDAEIEMTLTRVGEDMSGSGRTPEPQVEEPVVVAYRVVDDTIEVETGLGTAVIEAAEVIPDKGSMPVRLNGEAGYTAEISPTTLRLTQAAPADSDREDDEIIRCERLFDL